MSTAEIDSPQQIDFSDVPPGSRLGMVLGGLDPNYALEQLTARQGEGVHDKQRPRKILELHYGLHGEEQMTLRGVAKHLGFSEAVAHRSRGESLIALEQIRSEVRPEAVFPRQRIFGIDNAYLLSKQYLRKRAKVGWSIAAPRHEYPEE